MLEHISEAVTFRVSLWTGIIFEYPYVSEYRVHPGRSEANSGTLQTSVVCVHFFRCLGFVFIVTHSSCWQLSYLFTSPTLWVSCSFKQVTYYMTEYIFSLRNKYFKSVYYWLLLAIHLEHNLPLFVYRGPVSVFLVSRPSYSSRGLMQKWLFCVQAH